jgi:hypothetical protein
MEQKSKVDKLETEVEELRNEISEVRGEKQRMSEMMVEAMKHIGSIEEIEDDIEEIFGKLENHEDRLQEQEGRISGHDPEDKSLDDVLNEMKTGAYVGEISNGHLDALYDRYNEKGYVSDGIHISHKPSIGPQSPKYIRLTVSAAIFREMNGRGPYYMGKFKNEIKKYIGCSDENAKEIRDKIVRKWGLKLKANYNRDKFWIGGLDSEEKVAEFYERFENDDDMKIRYNLDNIGRKSPLAFHYIWDKLTDVSGSAHENVDILWNRYPVELQPDKYVEDLLDDRRELKEGMQKSIDESDDHKYDSADEWIDDRVGDQYLWPSDLEQYLETGELPDRIDPIEE